MENLNFEDRLNVQDSRIKGVVVMEDNEGDVVFKKENMIVTEGRNYIKTLVLDKILGSSSEARKINSIQFGTGNDMTTSNKEALTAPIVAYNKTLSEEGWFKRTYDISFTVEFGSADPEVVVVGSYFFNTTANLLKIGTLGSPDSWELISPIEASSIIYDELKTDVRRYNGVSWDTLSVVTEFPGINPALGTYIYRSDLLSLYQYDIIFKAENLTGEVGVQFTIVLQGNDANSQMISEMALFLDGTGSKMFSRVVFEPVPVNNSTTYRLKYYIYF
jgi:hypothetical protein